MNIFMRLIICLALTTFSLVAHAQANGNRKAAPVEVENGPNNPVPVVVVETGPASGETVHIQTTCPANGGIFVPIYPVPEGLRLLITDIIAYTAKDVSQEEGASALDIYANAYGERSFLTSFLFRPFVTVSHAFQTPIPVEGESELECRVNQYNNPVTLTIMGRLVEN